MANLERPFGIAGLQKLLSRREHQAFLDELLFALEDADPLEVDFLQALGGEGLHLLLSTDAPATLLDTYAELLLAGKVHAPVETVVALHDRLPSAGLDVLVHAIQQEDRLRVRKVADRSQPTIQLKRVIQIIDMSFGDYSASDALGIRRSVFRSAQERTFLQALALRFPGLHAFPNYPLDQLWAGNVGPNATAMIRHHVENRSDAANGLKAARRMRDMARLHGEARFEEVCAYALPLNITALRSVESILKQSPDKRPLQPTGIAPRPAHDNVRGATYFGENA